jgi:hypothetical protein
MTALDDPIIQALMRLAQAQPNIAALWLYGSRARGDHHANSDYDLAVAFSDWLDDPLERRLRPEVLALDWQQALALDDGMLSVADMGSAPIPLCVSVLTQGKLLTDSQPGERMRQEARILSFWEIDYLHPKGIYA